MKNIKKLFFLGFIAIVTLSSCDSNEECGQSDIIGNYSGTATFLLDTPDEYKEEITITVTAISSTEIHVNYKSATRSNTIPITSTDDYFCVGHSYTIGNEKGYLAIHDYGRITIAATIDDNGVKETFNIETTKS